MRLASGIIIWFHRILGRRAALSREIRGVGVKATLPSCRASQHVRMNKSVRRRHHVMSIQPARVESDAKNRAFSAHFRAAVRKLKS